MLGERNMVREKLKHTYTLYARNEKERWESEWKIEERGKSSPYLLESIGESGEWNDLFIFLK